MDDALALDRFGVDPARGFLPAADPARSLPAAFAAWDEAGEELPKLLAADRVHVLVEALPRLDPAGLPDDPARRRAMMLLSFLGHAYVWGSAETPATIPEQLAAPWAAVAAMLGRPPVLSYASYALDNWRRFDASQPPSIGNTVLLQNFLGGLDEEWFVLVHIEIEARAATVVRAGADAAHAASAGDAPALSRALRALQDGLQSMVETLHRMPERCDPYIYFHRVRPYIHGWRDHPQLPDGLVYEGVPPFAGRPQRFRGETGAQSSIVPFVDATLGISHAEDALAQYLREMRDYMPPQHREAIAAMRERSAVRTAARDAADARAAYDACVESLAAFRSLHLEYASAYVHRQSGADPDNPQDVGTGGTPFMAYLRKHRDETLAQRLTAS